MSLITDTTRHHAGVDTEALDTLDQLAINTIRTLAMDAVQQANSGHPGTPMALAPVAYCLWQHVLRFDPDDPIWPNRDRFVLSAGHASMLLYSLLHLTGVKAVNPKYETLGELVGHARRHQAASASWTANARAIRSTAGRRGVETTTGPLGQGVGNSVGMAIAERWLAQLFQSARLRAVRLQRLRPLRRRRHDGRHLQRSRVAGRPSEAVEPVLDLRQQPHHHRRQHRAGVHRRRRDALHRLRLERHARRRRQRSRRCSSARSTRSSERPIGRR